MTSGIGARLAYLQIVEGSQHRKRAEANRVRTLPKQPERGNIFDRNGKLLASTRYPRSVYFGRWRTLSPHGRLWGHV